MAASGNKITVAQDGGTAKLHPYLVALVRWCVSCLWSTATVLLHRVMIKPVPQIAGSTAKLSKPRPAGREHLHPEPRVECVVLHQPEVHNLDVIFVHGLYGSLCNTWRQGEWRSKYQSSPEKIHIRRPAASPSPCTCLICNKSTNEDVNTNSKKNFCSNDKSLDEEQNCFNYETGMVYYSEKDNKYVYEENKCDNSLGLHINDNISNAFDSEKGNSYAGRNAFRNIDENFYEDFRKILPKDEVFITENFYNNTLLDQVEIIENYETQAQFVSDLFKNCDNGCDTKVRTAENEQSNGECQNNNERCRKSVGNKSYHENCTCVDKRCEVGCGCNCDDCYSPCWPKDWIKVDYPDARVISINYTSDPHLWRPIWIKENKRLCLHERAEQMTEQLLELGVGQRPVIWVGHSKGGLFIKQIYCEAYEAYLNMHPQHVPKTNGTSQDTNSQQIDNVTLSIITENVNNNNENGDSNEQNMHYNIEYKNTYTSEQTRNNSHLNLVCNINTNLDDNKNSTILRVNDLQQKNNKDLLQSSVTKEEQLRRRASLWENSGAFMFYSVPHRGSSLADIKIPIAARSIELMEISKDNSLVLSLQERWLRATASSKPLVRSLVETRRTLMSVLWLRIVSTDSADPGIGALCGVSVDHREICKPSSRQCLLYTELATLIKAMKNVRDLTEVSTQSLRSDK